MECAKVTTKETLIVISVAIIWQFGVYLPMTILKRKKQNMCVYIDIMKYILVLFYKAIFCDVNFILHNINI